jgi:hypothetical protein
LAQDPGQYQGFQHFPKWDGTCANGVEIKMPFSGQSDNVWPQLGVWLDLCAADPKCDQVGGIYGAHDNGYFAHFRQRNYTTEYDTFLAVEGEPGTAPDAFCSVEAGGGNSPDTKWLHCDLDYVPSALIINTFALPPNLIHSTCLQTPNCTGFRIKNDGSAGDIFGTRPAGSGASQGWFKLRQPHPETGANSSNDGRI